MSMIRPISIAQWFAYLAAALSLMSMATADTIDWGNESGGAYEDPSNWIGEMVPGQDEIARFNLDAAYSVEMAQDHENSGLLLQAGDVSFNLGSHTWKLWSSVLQPSITLGLASGDDAMLRLLSGTLESHTTIFGAAEESTGTAIVSGADSVFTLAGGGSKLEVGRRGTGSLSILDGGQLVSQIGRGEIGVNSGSMGAVTVRGAGSTWSNGPPIVVGRVGSGSLKIVESGSVTSWGGLHRLSRR